MLYEGRIGMAVADYYAANKPRFEEMFDNSEQRVGSLEGTFAGKPAPTLLYGAPNNIVQ